MKLKIARSGEFFIYYLALTITLRLNDWINEYLLVMGNIDIYIIVYWSKKGSL